MPDITAGKNSFFSKADLRREMRRMRPQNSVFAEEWLALFCKLPLEAELLIGYIPLPDEPDCMQIMQSWLARKKRLFLPVFDESAGVYELAETGGLGGTWLAKGKYGIPEPKLSIERKSPPCIFEAAALWLVPGLAFTLSGARLGRGAGYYDRLLAGGNAIKIGVTYNSRIRQVLPVEEHDMKMDWLLTETGPVCCTMRQ